MLQNLKARLCLASSVDSNHCKDFKKELLLSVLEAAKLVITNISCQEDTESTISKVSQSTFCWKKFLTYNAPKIFWRKLHPGTRIFSEQSCIGTQVKTCHLAVNTDYLLGLVLLSTVVVANQLNKQHYKSYY